MTLNYLLFRLLDTSSLEKTKTELKKKGLKDIFIIEDDAIGALFIGGHSKKSIKTSSALLVEKKKATVNWEEQWSLFAENFSEGKAHIHLGDKTLLLTPGPGFGDLSHPTTYLMIELLKHYVPKESIIDIGCGSGILSLASLLLGAKSATGIDIDPAAIFHAKENNKLNRLKATFAKSLPKRIPKQNILLMNMILPEQLQFNPSKLNHLTKLWITSGILSTQKKAYLRQAKKWGWTLVHDEQKGEWCGFVFSV